MDGSRFDSWTRRRFGVASGGALAAAIGRAGFDDAEGGRKKRKRRCRRLNQSCLEDSKKQRCCKDLSCDEGKVVLTSLSCCRHFQAHCESEIECCTSFQCQLAVGLAGNRCCAPLGAFCEEDRDCCAGDGVVCESIRHECCRRVQTACAADDECCGDLFCKNVPALGGGLHCCAEEGDECAGMNDCCSGMGCHDGHCAD